MIALPGKATKSGFFFPSFPRRLLFFFVSLSLLLKRISHFSHSLGKMKISEKHLHSVIPKPHDSDEDDPKVELNEDDEVVNLEAVTERLATDLKLTVLKGTEGEEGEGDKTDYNGSGMAKKYAEAKTHEWRNLIETYTFLQLAKDGKGEARISANAIVDLACGEGHYTRALRKAFPTATRVVGVDIAEEMVLMAREKEKNKPIGITYVVQDVKDEAGAKDEERFDLATAAWLLVYCKTKTELKEMCEAVANYVKPGGRFLTIITNPQLAFDSEGTPQSVLPGETQTNVLSRYAKYGFTVTVPSETPQEGDRIHWSIKTSKGPLLIDNYYIPRDAYKDSLFEAGFEKIKFHPFELDPKSEGLGRNFAISPFSHLEDADSNDKKEFYQEFLDYPPALVIECWKSGGKKK